MCRADSQSSPAFSPFFSLSQSKRPQYILPLIPAVALLIAAIWPAVRMRAAGQNPNEAHVRSPKIVENYE